MIRGRELREEVGKIITIKKKRFFFIMELWKREKSLKKLMN